MLFYFCFFLNTYYYDMLLFRRRNVGGVRFPRFKSYIYEKKKLEYFWEVLNLWERKKLHIWKKTKMVKNKSRSLGFYLMFVLFWVFFLVKQHHMASFILFYYHYYFFGMLGTYFSFKNQNSMVKTKFVYMALIYSIFYLRSHAILTTSLLLKGNGWHNQVQSLKRDINPSNKVFKFPNNTLRLKVTISKYRKFSSYDGAAFC